MPTPSPPVSAEVLARAKRGDRLAHAELYGLFAGPVFTLARRILASKLWPRTCCRRPSSKCSARSSGFRGDAEVGTWIKRIAINKCLMHMRSHWISRRGPTIGELAGEPESGTLDDQMALERALDQVADMARAVVWLHDVEGYTHAEIGRLMGRTASFSKSQLARAHERLRALLEGPKVESETSLCTPELKTC